MSANVLLVDDDPAVLACAAAALSRFGHAVTRAGSAEAALLRLAEAEFDLLVTDFRMPGMGGVGLIDAAHKRRPDLPVVIITGIVAEIPIRLRVGPRAVHILPKPFQLGSLRTVVEAALAVPATLPA